VCIDASICPYLAARVFIEVSLLAFFVLGFLLFNSSSGTRKRQHPLESGNTEKELRGLALPELLAKAAKLTQLNENMLLCCVQGMIEAGREAEVLDWLRGAAKRAACMRTSQAAKQIMDILPPAQACMGGHAGG